MKSGKSRISSTRLRNVLKNCQFSPNDPGPIAVIIDANDTKYWEQRAIEQIGEIHRFKLEGHEATDRIELAIKLLALSLVKRELDSEEGPYGS